MNYYNHTRCPKLPWMVDFYSTEHGKVPISQLKAAYAHNNLDHMVNLNIKSKIPPFRAVQLICTLPSYNTCDFLEGLLENRTSCIRIKIKSFDKNEKQKTMELLSKIRAINDHYSQKIGRLNPLAIALEVNGPEVKIGSFKDSKADKICLEEGDSVLLTTEKEYADYVTKDKIYVDYPHLTDVIQKGDSVLFNNGEVRLSAIKICESIVKCIVEKAGEIASQSTVNFPGALLPNLSPADEELVDFAIEQGVDVVFISNVFRKESLTQIRTIIREARSGILLFSKIENEQAVENFEGILNLSDGVCMESERLMCELPKEKVFLAEKSVIGQCLKAGKPVLVNAIIQNIESVSKAEISNIANNIMEGVDGFILPSELSNVKCLIEIDKIAKEANPAIYQRQIFHDIIDSSTIFLQEPIYALMLSAVEASLKCNSAAIIVITSSGRSVKILSRYKPRCPIIVLTRHGRVARQLRLYRGVDPIIYVKPYDNNWQADLQQRIQLGITYAKYSGYVKMGDTLVSVYAARPDTGFTNSMNIFYASKFDQIESSKSKEEIISKHS